MALAMTKTMVAIGNFLFRTRNWLFPLFILLTFIPFRPTDAVFGSHALKVALAIGVVALGLLTRASVVGFAYIKRGGLKKKVYADNLVTDGIFGVVRNPLYVGNVLIYIGLYIMHGHPVTMAIGIVAFLFAFQCIVFAEENFLRNKFGPGFDDYCRDVPRWWPRIGKLGGSIEGMSFNFQRTIFYEYTAVANAVMLLTATWAYDAWNKPAADHGQILVRVAWVVGICVVAVGLIAGYKKRDDIARWFGKAPSGG
jgi:protein-S-isoprenylcysteine O-methyltransferase Ste14